ncbi:MAG: Asp-tRNA(Asn)/Glu-tRNA(Gln) amidotransferase subunit GatA [Marinifilaceae bacterium]
MLSSLRYIQEALEKGSQTHVSIVSAYLGRIRGMNTQLNAFVEVYEREALQRAQILDEQYSKGIIGRLAGMVVAVKDNICQEGHICSAGSRMLKNFTSQYSATALQRLIDEGAIIIGRTNCDEFAMGSTGETSFYGLVRNPYNSDCVAGGSSGGSAAAVAAGMCLAALGSDTGGSVRQPAAFCGVMGFKPSYGRVSRYGLISYASSLDQIGLLTQNVEDAGLMLEVMAGPDEIDATLSLRSFQFKQNRNTEKPYRLAYLKEAFDKDKLEKEMFDHFETFLIELKAEGHWVEGIDFPLFEYLVPTYSVLAMAEASSNLARYSGMHFGFRSKKVDKDLVTASRTQGFGDEVKKRIMAGSFVLTSGVYSSYFSKAQKIRRKICNAMEAIFQDYDGLILPVTTSPAYPVNHFQDDSVAMLSDDCYSVLANLAGLPAIALPIGKHSSELPLGVQILAERFDDDHLLEMALQLQRN